MYYVYLLISEKNKRTYIGFTEKNPQIRTQEHNKGSNIFSKQNAPWRLIYYESLSCKTCAMRRELFFKTGVGKKLKKIIIENF